MAKKISTRRITADDGTKITFTLVNKYGVVVEDDRNAITMTNLDGDELSIPLSPQVVERTVQWFEKVGA